MSGEKKRLEQFLLQTRAFRIDPRFAPHDINRLRLLESQRLAGKVPVSERLKKEQKKKKKKARRTKQLRGDLARNLTEQRRFIKGERRDKDTEEPRIVGDPKPVPVGAAYDPEIERRRLDIQQAAIDQNRLDRIADRAETRRRQEAELAVRRGELAAGRAERALIRAAIPPPAAPIVIPPAAAPVINVAAPVLPLTSSEREDADPIPEIIRLGDRLRGDYDAFGADQDARNREGFAQLREQIDLETRQNRQTLETIEARQQAQDENRRADIARQDAQYQQFEERLGAGERALGEGREEVIREIRGAEDRLRGAQRDLDTPSNYDDVILQAVDRAVLQGFDEARTPTPGSRFEEVTPTPEAQPSPSLARPNTPVSPVTLEEDVAVVEGGGELNLPPVLVGGSSADREREERLRLSPVEQRRVYPRGTAGSGQLRPLKRGGAGPLRAESAEQRKARKEAESEAQGARQEEPEEVEPVLQEEEEEQRLRLTTTQDFLSGFDRPVEPEPEPTVSPSLEAARSARLVSQRSLPEERVIEPAGIVAQPPQEQQRELRPLDPDVLFEPVEEAEQVGQVQDTRPQLVRDSFTLYNESIPELAANIRTGPRGPREKRKEGTSTRVPGLGFRVRNNTDRTLKKVAPGDVVNVIGVEEGEGGEGRYRLDTETVAGTRIGLDQFGPLVNDGSFLFERGHRHELGGHFDREPYGPPAPRGGVERRARERLEAGGGLPGDVERAGGEPGLLQQGAEAAGGAAAAVVGGAGRLAGGLALGAAQGVAEQLPSAGDVGAALGRGAVGAVAGAGRLAAGAVGAIVGGEEEAPQPTLSSDE